MTKLERLVDPPDLQREPIWYVTTKPKLFSGGGGLVSTAPDYLRFCQMMLMEESIGPAAGSTWGLGFAIRRDAESRSAVPGSVGSYTWSGAGGILVFGWTLREKLVVVGMVQGLYESDSIEQPFAS